MSSAFDDDIIGDTNSQPFLVPPPFEGAGWVGGCSGPSQLLGSSEGERAVGGNSSSPWKEA
jgi:hypothetical protein